MSTLLAEHPPHGDLPGGASGRSKMEGPPGVKDLIIVLVLITPTPILNERGARRLLWEDSPAMPRAARPPQPGGAKPRAHGRPAM